MSQWFFNNTFIGNCAPESVSAQEGAAIVVAQTNAAVNSAANFYTLADGFRRMAPGAGKADCVFGSEILNFPVDHTVCPGRTGVP